MTPLIWKRVATLVIVVIGAGFAGTWTAEQLRQREAARRDQLEVERMTREVKTLCRGRFLIDMPQEALLEPLNLRVDGFDIEASEESAEDFRLRLGLRERRLKAEPRQLAGVDYLESVAEVNTVHGVTGKIFVYGRTVSEGTRMSGPKLERYRYENVAGQAMVHGDGVSFEPRANKYSPDLIGDLPKLIAKLVPNRSNRAPTAPGFCFDRGWLRDPLTADQGEQITVFAQLRSHPDIHLSISLHAGMRPEEQGLLERSTNAYQRYPRAAKKRIHRLRTVERTIAGLTGDELVEEFDENNNIVVHSFWWEAMGTENDVLNPRFSLEMDTGKRDNGQVSSSLSRSGALALWDKISSSIRRHHAPPAPATGPAT